MKEHGLFTVREALDQLPFSITKLYDLINAGEIGTTKMGRTTLISQKDIDLFNGKLKSPERPIRAASYPDAVPYLIIEGLEEALLNGAGEEKEATILLKGGGAINHVVSIKDAVNAVVVLRLKGGGISFVSVEEIAAAYCA